MARFIVMGAGAIGAGLGGLLHESGHSVTLVARGPHRAAMAAHGLAIAQPASTRRLSVPTVLDPADAPRGPDTIVLLAVKSQHTRAALTALRLDRNTPVVCLQNGVVNEDCAAEYVDEVYGAMVWVPATLLEPGRVELHGVPPGVLIFGRWPSGEDATSRRLAAAFSEAGFAAHSRPDVRRFKYAKLLTNLLGTAQALCGPDASLAQVRVRLIEEGERALAAAGIDFAPNGELEQLVRVVAAGEIDGQARRGGSTWQSLARGADSMETGFLNGEIVRLGRAHGVDTPVNAALVAAAEEAIAEGLPPGHLDPAVLLSL